jgi:hypothetical protein
MLANVKKFKKNKYSYLVCGILCCKNSSYCKKSVMNNKNLLRMRDNNKSQITKYITTMIFSNE